MKRRIVLIALAACLLPLGAGCRDTKQKQAARTVRAGKLESLMASYDPKRIKEFIKVKKGKGEGAKVTVHISPSSSALAIGQLNFGTYVERVSDYRGWYGIRYYNRDGGEFFGWIRIDQAEYVGSQDTRNEVIAVEDEHKKLHLTLQESDDEMMAILAVPYEVYQKDPTSRARKRFSGSAEPDGYDDISLLSTVAATSESRAWARERQKMLVELSKRAHADYIPILQAYWSAIDWYVKGQKDRFTQQLKTAVDKRNDIARFFGN
jgi:hypothetical protein